jgi:hypothetical protein
LNDAINAFGLQVAIYQSLAVLSVVVLYRRHLFRSLKNFILIGLWPLVGAVFMIMMFVKDVPTLNGTTPAVGLGAVDLGVMALVYYWVKGNPYYKMPCKLDRVVRLEEVGEIERPL